MSYQLSSSPPEVFRRRRQALAHRLGETAALLFAGGSRERNYAANVYPFRASSHFLYLAGAGIPDAVLLVDGETSLLFLPEDEPDGPLWHGAQPGADEIRERTGVDRVLRIKALRHEVELRGGGARIATLPCPDPITRIRQCSLLGRCWRLENRVGVSELEALDLELADALIELRLHHDEAAVAALRNAAAATAAAHEAGMRVSRPGLRESEVRAAMERELIAAGAECAYGSIVSVRGEVLHNDRHDGTLGPGDLLLADVGGEHEGWASDVTRTWPVGGRFSPTQRALYDVVLAAEEAAIAMVKPGVRYRDVHLGASLVIARGLVDLGILRGDPETLVGRGAHALLFPHGVGHLLGLDVHDMEDLGDRAGYAPGRERSRAFGLGYLRLDRDLAPGMAFTIEPGIYLVPQILDDPEIAGPFIADGTLDRARLSQFADVRGIRIEDDVLLGEAGTEVLTAAIPKRPDEVEARVGRSAPV